MGGALLLVLLLVVAPVPVAGVNCCCIDHSGQQCTTSHTTSRCRQVSTKGMCKAGICISICRGFESSAAPSVGEEETSGNDMYVNATAPSSDNLAATLTEGGPDSFQDMFVAEVAV